MPFYVIKVSEADRDRVNDLAARLTAEGPGRFGQAEVIRHLLDCYDDATRQEDAS